MPPDLASEIRAVLNQPQPKTVPMTLSATALVNLYARLRMAAAAMDCRQEDIRLDDLLPSERMRLINEGRKDFWRLIHGEIEA